MTLAEAISWGLDAMDLIGAAILLGKGLRWLSIPRI